MERPTRESVRFSRFTGYLCEPARKEVSPCVATPLSLFTPPFHYEIGCDNACAYEPVAGSGRTGVIHLGEVEKSQQ